MNGCVPLPVWVTRKIEPFWGFCCSTICTYVFSILDVGTRLSLTGARVFFTSVNQQVKAIFDPYYKKCTLDYH